MIKNCKVFLGATALTVAATLATVPSHAAPIGFDIIVNYLPSGVVVDSDGDQNPATGAQNPTVSFSARQKQLFGAAESFWESILTGFTGLVNAVFHLDAWMTSEDGFDGSLAFAGPRSFETQSGFDRATTGIMQFDADDFGPSVLFPQSEQLFLDSAVHEVGHALGFGTQFDSNGLIDGTGRGYIGSNALTAFNITNGFSVSSILLQSGGGHWDECWIESVTNAGCIAEDGEVEDGLNAPELMTPFAIDGPATVSAATIAAFRDLGYTTIDPFTPVSIPLASQILPPVTNVPIPSTMLLFGLGLLSLTRMRGYAARKSGK